MIKLIVDTTVRVEYLLLESLWMSELVQVNIASVRSYLVVNVRFVAKDFIRNLMCKDVKKRFTCKKALAHSW